NASFTATIADATRLCMLEDDVNFALDGTAMNQIGTAPYGTVDRERRYSWAYMCRRPKASDFNVVDMTVVIYAGRPITGQPFNPPPEPRYQAQFQQNSTTVMVVKTAGQTWPLALRRGDWILDNTLIMPGAVPNPTVPGGVIYGPFRPHLE